MANNSIFEFDLQDDGIAIVSFEVEGEAQNVLKQEFIDEADSLIKDIAQQKEIKGVIFTSRKPKSFIAGADINMLNSAKTVEEAEQMSRNGHIIFDKIEALNIPVVAAIDGVCLGGGLEFALACHGRVCSDDKSTKLGLPEVQIGLLPGGGGTQRLPKLIGIAASLDLMLTGKQVFPKKALKLGLVDEVTASANLIKAARKRLMQLRKGQQKKKSIFSMQALQTLALEKNPIGRNILFDQAKKQLLKKTKGNYPAPEKILECVEKGVSQGKAAGFAIEAKNFAELVMSSEAKSLINIFFATTELKKDTGIDSDVQPATIDKVGVLGGGLMGSGIAYVSADKANKMVRIKDISADGINKALNYSWKIISKKVKRRFISDADAKKTMSRLTGSINYDGFHDCDMVIEAVFEKLELKHQMVNEVEANCSNKTIFATNTSSIPITEIAKAAKRPEQVVGLHYFSPVEKMPLLEIITTPDTADWVVASCVELGKKQGKTPIVVNDGAGFYVNRILAPYMNEAGLLLSEGVAVEQLDKALVKAGFPVGPITLLDEVGIDVATKVAPILEDAFGERMAPPKIFERLIADNRLGKKNGKGFYQYGKKQKGPKEVDSSVYQLLGVEPTKSMSNDEIAERGILLMLNEAVRCLDEGIIRSARDGDIGAIFGIGFPPFRGGPFRYMDGMGIEQVIARLKHYEALHGERFSPAAKLVSMAEQKETFYG
ncbi:fatty acid oxidation complex subunit alpha FadJ [Kangiella sp. HZ709]|uniref:fatty acid oxidation complex subunit alpha FadJ n=1 Tax=Kangiella sp. HZ709 TaxID=2666328 RepID=UPI0012AEFBC0|nr:fatty acid oxidation complex subunit alpha FadJ [Kangiella sp. HZ709]MRX28506.1 fatty acid oxidation complex subunit alpha FadJ [Kangiella sp. HZ709]